MTVAVLKELLKDKGMAFSLKAKKSELVDLTLRFWKRDVSSCRVI